MTATGGSETRPETTAAAVPPALPSYPRPQYGSWREELAARLAEYRSRVGSAVTAARHDHSGMVPGETEATAEADGDYPAPSAAGAAQPVRGPANRATRHEGYRSNPAVATPQLDLFGGEQPAETISLMTPRDGSTT